MKRVIVRDGGEKPKTDLEAGASGGVKDSADAGERVGDGEVAPARDGLTDSDEKVRPETDIKEDDATEITRASSLHTKAEV